MAVRRIVTGTVNGKSAIVVDDHAPEIPMASNVWVASAEHPLGYDPVGVKSLPLEPPPGGSNWRMVEWPPDAVYRAQLAGNPMEGLDSADMHRTDTLDYVLILDGEIELELETGSVRLRSGDCVVQRATMHAWRNRSDRVVHMAVIMIDLSPFQKLEPG